MRFYFAGGENGSYTCLEGLDNLAFLVSYWTLRKGKMPVVDWCNERSIPLLLDSGAYSAFTQKKEIDVYDYIDFCKEHGHRFEHIVGLDVIKNPEATKENWNIMVKSGIDCWPTFHIDCDFSYLEYYLSVTNYIALGIAGQKSKRAKLKRWLDYCFHLRNKINPDCKIHGFAIGSAFLLSEFPFYSTDSTTWIKGQTFGVLIVNEGHILNQYLRCDWPKAKEKHSRIPEEVFVPLKGKNKWYCPLLRWNVQEILSWLKERKSIYSGVYSPEQTEMF